MELVSERGSHSILRYITGRDSAITDIKNTFGETGLSRALDVTKSKLDADQIEYWSGFIDYHEAILQPKIDRFLSENPKLNNLGGLIKRCGLGAVYKDKNVDVNYYDKISSVNFKSGRFGHFNVTAKSCNISSAVGTKNRYSEPEKWDGSQFVVIDVLFKNMDKEGRLPLEGRLIIKTPEGEELKYDSTETIMESGYGIYFKSVNPLVTMPTKIVYRIPSDIVGEVLWEPGRNPDGKYLWCKFLSKGD